MTALTTILKPCPFCGCTDVHDSGLYFECMNDSCMTLGPTGKTPEMAVEAWNRRAPLAVSEASAEPVQMSQEAFRLQMEAAYDLGAQEAYMRNALSEYRKEPK